MTYIFDCYDNTGQTGMGTGTHTVNLDTTRLENPSGSSSPFSLSSDVLTINETATYIFHFRVHLEYTSGTLGDESAFAFLEVDTGSGYTEVDGTRCYPFDRLSTPRGTPAGTAHATAAIAVTSGDAFRLRLTISSSGSGTYQSLADSSGLLVWRDEAAAPADAQYLVASSDADLSSELVAQASNEGIAFTYSASAGTASWDLNFSGLSAYTTPQPGDFICVYDDTAKAHKKTTMAQLMSVATGQAVANSALTAAGAPPETLAGLADYIAANIDSSSLAADAVADAVTILEAYRDNSTNAGTIRQKGRESIHRALARLSWYSAHADNSD